MKSIFAATALLCAPILAAGAAHADTTYAVDKVTITGSKTVPTQKLLDAIQTHKGSHVTQSDIKADQNTITKVLGEANVVGGIKTSMVSKPNKHIEVIFAITDQGAQATVVKKVAPTLHAETFSGNAVLTTDQLAAAAGLKAGDGLTDARIAAAQKAIVDAYAAAKKPIDVKIGASISQSGLGADIAWQITETKAKPKKKTREELEREDQVQ